MTHIQDTYVKSIDGDMRDALLEVLRDSHQYNVRIKHVDKRTLTDVNGKTIYDFASCNYISFDQDQEALLEAGIKAAKEFGMHTSRARLMGYHELFTEVEKKLADFVGADESILFPNTTLTGIGIIPSLIKKGDLIVLDKSAHATMYQAAQMARDKGALLKSYPQNDLRALEQVLEENKTAPRKLICVDGVYSMTGDYACLNELVPLIEAYDALLYVDDGHGFGLVGENPSESMPYGYKGNGIVKHCGLEHDQIMYVAGTAKGFAAAAAFATVTPSMKEFLMAYAKPLDYTHPSTPFAVGVLLAALEHNERVGDERRAKVFALCKRLMDNLNEMGFFVMNDTYFPIISVWAGDTQKLVEASQQLYKAGIFLTSCPYPTMPRGKEALRITVTSNNTVEQIDHLLEAMNDVKKSWEKAGIALQPTEEQKQDLS